MYKPTIEKKQMSDLFRLKTFASAGTIVQQVRTAISTYLKTQEKVLGCTPEDLEEAILRHEKEKSDTQENEYSS